MRCSKCGRENRAGRKFCAHCGVGLTLVCSSCKAENEPGEQFCGDCGQRIAEPHQPPPSPDPRAYTPKHLAEKILTSRSALEGERKQVTVLFADLKGSMDLSESIDPEEWHKIMERFFRILADGVHRFEGTVNQYTGDGIMALFGAPIAHEDHAARACYAALALQEKLRGYADELRQQQGINFSVRMGMNSGEVVVGKIGDDLRMDYTALGHMASLGARMEQAAEPGKVYLSEHTAKLVEGLVAWRDLGKLAVKGVREPLGVFELLGVGKLRTRLEVSRARGFSRFVGRAEEMAALEVALHHAMQGSGQIVGIVAAPGVGKSRLCFEFLDRCRERGITTYEAHGVPHGKAIPFLPILELFRSFSGISDQDPPEIARETIAARIALLDESLREALPLLYDFLGVADPAEPRPRIDPEARQRQLHAVVKRITRLWGERTTTVTYVEDLQWFDGGSDQLLAQIVEALAGTRLLVIANFRPEYHARWMQRSYYQQLPLAPLGSEAVGNLLRDLLGGDPSLARLPGMIQERTGGNPFFIEEVVRMLLEDGHVEGSRGAYRLLTPLEKLAVPATVQAVLAGRIDQLPEREKVLLQTAAVIGSKFTESVLERILDPANGDLPASLRALTEAEFVYEQALYPETEYSFQHPLTQEVAYRSQLSERRARVHAAVARTIEELEPEKLDERAALLAHHWEQAGDISQAVRWHRRAAEWAARTHHFEALEHWRSVCRLMDTLPETPQTLAQRAIGRAQMTNLFARLGASREEVERLFAEGRELATKSGSPRALGAVLTGYGNFRLNSGDLEAGGELFLGAVAHADRTDDVGLRAIARYGSAAADIVRGSFLEGLKTADEGIELCRNDPMLGADLIGLPAHVPLSIWRGIVLVAIGRLDEAAIQFDHLIELSRKQGQPRGVSAGYTGHSLRCELVGDPRSALAHGRESVRIIEQTESELDRLIAYHWLGRAHVLNEQWIEAVEVLDQAREIGRSRGLPLWDSAILATVSLAYLGLGDHARARQAAEEAIALALRIGCRAFELLAHLALARILRGTEGAQAMERIEGELAAALAFVETSGAKGYEPLVRLERAEVARLRGDEATRQRELREAYRLFTQIGATGHAERLAKDLGL
jgi:class 3 adenylate cyclase/tetratricopeptide (TPR) repeat protein